MRRRISRGIVTWLVVVAFVNATIFSLPLVGLAGCDDRGTTASVGACYTPPANFTVCAGEGMTACMAASHVHIEPDWPLDCKDKDDYNCNKPNANCWRYILCNWDEDNEKCVEATGTDSWKLAIKPTEVECNP